MAAFKVSHSKPEPVRNLTWLGPESSREYIRQSLEFWGYLFAILLHQTYNDATLFFCILSVVMLTARDREFRAENEFFLDPTYSIVIPAYNESARLAATLENVLAYVHACGWNAEIIVVNDGSRDNTAEIVRDFAAKDSILRLVENPGNRGKGYSVRNGMLHARGRIVLFTDADLSAPIEEASKLIHALDSGADVAIGSRWLRAETQTQRQPFYRQVFGRAFNLMLRSTLGLKFKDTQCGFKAFKQRAAQAIFPLQKIERWGFDPEILFLAHKFGFRVQEIPVFWGHSGGTRIHPLTDGSRMFLEMIYVRWNDLMGKYDSSVSTTAEPAKAISGRTRQS